MCLCHGCWWDSTWEAHSTPRCILRLATLFCSLLSTWNLLESPTSPLCAGRGEPPATFSPMGDCAKPESTKLPRALAHNCPISHHQRPPPMGNFNCPQEQAEEGQGTVCQCIRQAPLQVRSWPVTSTDLKGQQRLPASLPRARVIRGHSAHPSATHPLTPPRC